MLTTKAFAPKQAHTAARKPISIRPGLAVDKRPPVGEDFVQPVREKGFPRGGVAEWFKAPVLKTGRRKPRGFESHPHRHFYWKPCRNEDTLPFPTEGRGVRTDRTEVGEKWPLKCNVHG